MKSIITLMMILFASHAQAADVAIARGVFHGGNYAPSDTASGGATLVKLSDGAYALRLGDDFSTTPGPDLFVYLSASPDPQDGAAITDNDFINAGKLVSPEGGQMLALPKDFDPAKFKSIAIWCKSFSVLFGAAALSSP